MTWSPRYLPPSCQPKEAVYLFCLALPPASDEPAEGLEPDRPVCRMTIDGVVAVVCHIPIASWVGEQGEKNLSALAWVGPRAVRHQNVIDETMQHRPVLPVRFGTLFHNTERLEQFVRTHRQQVLDFLQAVAGRQEWAVKGYLDRAKAVEALLEMRAASGALPAAPGARYLMQQRLRVQLSAEVDEYLLRWQEPILAALTGLAGQVVQLRASGEKKDGEEFVFHWSLLLTPEAVAALPTLLDQLNEEWSQHGIRLAGVGPWPPYSFCPSLSD